eukprot:Filipodium_phascolosomae@DN2889_c0_g1_i1.p1
MKIENIMVSEDGHGTLTDFGSSTTELRKIIPGKKLSVAESLALLHGFGTPKYMSPEQLHYYMKRSSPDAKEVVRPWEFDNLLSYDYNRDEEWSSRIMGSAPVAADSFAWSASIMGAVTAYKSRDAIRRLLNCFHTALDTTRLISYFELGNRKYTHMMPCQCINKEDLTNMGKEIQEREGRPQDERLAFLIGKLSHDLDPALQPSDIFLHQSMNFLDFNPHKRPLYFGSLLKMHKAIRAELKRMQRPHTMLHRILHDSFIQNFEIVDYRIIEFNQIFDTMKEVKAHYLNTVNKDRRFSLPWILLNLEKQLAAVRSSWTEQDTEEMISFTEATVPSETGNTQFDEYMKEHKKGRDEQLKWEKKYIGYILEETSINIEHFGDLITATPHWEYISDKVMRLSEKFVFLITNNWERYMNKVDEEREGKANKDGDKDIIRVKDDDDDDHWFYDCENMKLGINRVLKGLSDEYYYKLINDYVKMDWALEPFLVTNYKGMMKKWDTPLAERIEDKPDFGIYYEILGFQEMLETHHDLCKGFTYDSRHLYHTHEWE